MRPRLSPLVLPLLLPLPLLAQEVVVTADDTAIEASATIRIDAETIADANGDGAIRVQGSNLVVDFTGSPLRGAAPAADPDQRTGIGLVVTGDNIVIRGLTVSGYKVGIQAVGTNGLVLEDCDVSDNYAARLLSTAQKEAREDWLWPHANDDGEWAKNYGAGILVRDARDVTVRGCRARRTQNGLLLERVTDSQVYDNDLSFLSGWGLAMWRSSNNVVSRNQFDFCVRGYRHGVYNRGQDSAGILMFEQCSGNSFLLNSAICGGDGVFGFAGKEALGEKEPPTADFDYTRRGNNDNLFLRNDLSYAAAHGLEMTFSFGNRILANRLSGNAICGIWGGYSQETEIRRNEFAGNGDMPYGRERGGINIEHGRGNTILENFFDGNAGGLRLWWDEDAHLAKLPWAEANGVASEDNTILGNVFRGGEFGIELEYCTRTRIGGNEFVDVKTPLDSNDDADANEPEVDLPLLVVPEAVALGTRDAMFKRHHLGGRAAIVMTEWGPYDYEAPRLFRLPDVEGEHAYRVLGPQTDLLALVTTAQPASARVVEDDGSPFATIRVSFAPEVAEGEYRLTAHLRDGTSLEVTTPFRRDS